MKKNRWKTKEAIQAAHDAAEVALPTGAQTILDASNAIAPIDEGTLIRSGHVVIDDLRVTIVYDAPYAIRQHEKLNYKHANGRKAKFLASAMQDNIDRVMASLTDELDNALK